MYKKLQTFKKNDVYVSGYTKELYKISLIPKKKEIEPKKWARYLNGLRSEI